MAYYRYSASYPDKDGNELTVRSMVPFSPETEKNLYYCHRYYTSEKDDSPYYYVVSLGHQKGWPGRFHGPRTVDRFIIHYVVGGKGEFQGEPVEAGQFFFTHPYETHTIRDDDQDPMEYYYIGIAGPGTEELMRRTGFFSIPKIHRFQFADQLPSVFHNALYQTHPKNDTELYLLSTFYYLLSLHQQENAKSASEHNRMDAFLYYKEALIFIQNYLLEGITAKDVAQHLHISPSYLRVIFSRYCKYSLRELMIRKRMECAASRLTFENVSVMQAAALVGYSDYTLFSKIFKKYTGMSPLAYKKQRCQIPILPENVNL